MEIKNVAIVGTSGAGKTSLVESILYTLNLINRLGKVEDGNTICDYNPDEIESKMSLQLAVVNFNLNDKRINLIDTPGFYDFVGERISALKVADCALIVVPADVGVDAGLVNIYEYILKEDIPFFIYLNKIDKENIDLDEILKNISRKLDRETVLLNPPINTGPLVNSYVNILNNKLTIINEIDKFEEREIIEEFRLRISKYIEDFTEKIASNDDILMEKYLNGETIKPEEMKPVMRKAFIEKKIIPVICGSAIRNLGAKEVANFISDFVPDASRRNLKVDSYSAIVFKTTSEPGMGIMNYVRLFSGRISTGDDVFNSTRNSVERIGQITFLFGKKRITTQTVEAGDICAFIKLKDTRTNDVLGKENLKQMEFPEPYVEMALVAKSKGEEEKVANAISSLLLEDPTFKFRYNPETKEMVATTIGVTQLKIITSRMKSRYGVEAEIRKPRIPYKETVTTVTTAEGKYKRQSGGRGQYGHCFLKVEPMERGKGYEFVDEIYAGVIPKNFIPSVEKGVISALNDGVVAGYPVTDVRVTLYDGSFHEVDSSDIAFQIAARMALQKCVLEGNPIILEPIMELEIKFPEEYLSNVISDINARRGKVLGMEKSGELNVVRANIPWANCYNYVTDLVSLTKGYGKVHMKLSHYEQTPAHIQQALIEEYKKSKEQQK